MRGAWLLGVLIFIPGQGRAVLGGSPKEFSALLNTGELPPIRLAPLPEHPGAVPAQVRSAVRGSAPKLPLRAVPIFLRTQAAPQLLFQGHPLSEVEKLGEDLRNAVRPQPTLEGFLGAVRDPDPAGRAAAVEAFGYEGNFAAIPYISAVLLRLDELPAVRAAAARALGRVGDRRARSFLASALRGGEPAVRLASAAALERIRSGTRSGGPAVLAASLP